jgi:DNA-binding NarL/FixJ family response regulator
MKINQTTCLTQRETEVLKYVLLGYTNKQIAETLVVTPFTVKAHISSILHKTGVKNRVDLALFATAHGYTNPHQG